MVIQLLTALVELGTVGEFFCNIREDIPSKMLKFEPAQDIFEGRFFC